TVSYQACCSLQCHCPPPADGKTNNKTRARRPATFKNQCQTFGIKVWVKKPSYLISRLINLTNEQIYDFGTVVCHNTGICPGASKSRTTRLRFYRHQSATPP